MSRQNDAIILYDGVCGLCDRFVQFVLRHDHEGKIRFAALQSDPGREMLRRFSLPENDISFVILIDGGKEYIKSAAVLRTLNYLGAGWRTLAVFRVIPSSLSDVVYDFIARHRYAWFGKYDQCVVPSAEVRKRFL